MKGIIFSEPLFHAVVEGRKTQTRRMRVAKEILSGQEVEFSPRYKAGETVYLKEPYFIDIKGDVCYKYEPQELLIPMCTKNVKWQNKLFMPARYARYFIEITDLRCERLQQITDSDCVKEGICINPNYDEDVKNGLRISSSSYIVNYAELIDTINGKGTWESNPYVWVYSFKLLK